VAAADGAVTARGGCHCGAVRFEVAVEGPMELSHCNCSICSMTGYVHLIVQKEQFRLLSGREHLSTYRFNSGVAEHSFCSVCGIKAFYVPRSHPDGYSVNARCLDGGVPKAARIRDFDGQNWERAAEDKGLASAEGRHDIQK
jgi:hypothetical protein